MHSGFLNTLSAKVYASLILLLCVSPIIIHLADTPYYLVLLTRALILCMAAASLNLIIGYAGMISLGHAAFIGIGAYCVGIPAYYDNYNGLFHLALAIVCSAGFALVTGAICLRTRGLYFIMITLAFAQMLYFTVVSLDQYGADDGLIIDRRSEFGGLFFDFIPQPFDLAFDLENPTTFYYLVLVLLLATLYLINRLVHAKFGRVIVGCKHNEQRMLALGYNTYLYQLTCYVISGVICGIAGFLLANFTYFISPEMMDWVHSGELIFMITLGGIASAMGALTGGTVFLLLEEFLSAMTQYWQLIFGLLLIVLVIFGKGGLHGLLMRLQARTASHTAPERRPGKQTRSNKA